MKKKDFNIKMCHDNSQFNVIRLRHLNHDKDKKKNNQKLAVV